MSSSDSCWSDDLDGSIKISSFAQFLAHPNFGFRNEEQKKKEKKIIFCVCRSEMMSQKIVKFLLHSPLNSLFSLMSTLNKSGRFASQSSRWFRHFWKSKIFLRLNVKKSFNSKIKLSEITTTWMSQQFTISSWTRTFRLPARMKVSPARQPAERDLRLPGPTDRGEIREQNLIKFSFLKIYFNN